MNREAIKKKIKALLSKTTENGASEKEAIAALEKAQQLMINYLISENEIKDPYLGEKCIALAIPRIKSGYDLTIFLGDLSRLFDCEYFYTTKTVTFFGFREDTDLCSYFYDFIIKACFAEKAKYIKSEEYTRMIPYYSGRTLIASFIRGFLSGICAKMRDMYECRKESISEEASLVVIEKARKVQVQFKVAGHNPKIVNTGKGEYVGKAYLNGLDKGKNTAITQAITNHNPAKFVLVE